jgi:hypothetical protein
MKRLALLFIPFVAACATGSRTFTAPPAPAVHEGRSLPVCGSRWPLTAATYADVTCRRNGLTFFYPDGPHLWNFESTGRVAVRPVRAEDFVIVSDPDGPYAFIVCPRNCRAGWSVKAGQSWTGTLTFSVSGAVETGLAVEHPQVTGDGSITAYEEITDAGVGSRFNCSLLETPACIQKFTMYGSPGSFTPSLHPVKFTWTLSGGDHGSASIQEWSQHFRPEGVRVRRPQY